MAEFLELLPENLRAEQSLANFKDVGSLAQGYLDSKRYGSMKDEERANVNERLLVLPGDNAKPEDWQAVYRKLGAPETPEKYELPKLDPAVKIDPAIEQAFRKTAHQHGLTPKQFQAVVTDQVQQQIAYAQQVGAATKQEYGGDYDRVVTVAKSAAKALGMEADLDAYIGYDPVTTKVLKLVGEKFLAESQAPKGGFSSTESLESIEAEIQRLRQTPEFKRGKKEATMKVYELTEKKVLLKNQL